jgi:hypothetical protein
MASRLYPATVGLFYQVLKVLVPLGLGERMSALGVQLVCLYVCGLIARGSGDERLKWYRLHLNEAGKVIDFGAVRTNGSVLVRLEGNEWVLQTLPRDGNFTLELNAQRFGAPAPIRCLGGATETVKPEWRGAWWRLRLNGAREYRWMASYGLPPKK